MKETTLGEVYQELRRRLKRAGLETANLDARLLVQAATGVSHERLIAYPEQVVDAASYSALMRMVEQRLNHEPVSRIIGEREFYGRAFEISPAVLDPRPDTETLVELALAVARRFDGGLRVLDAGTGSGAIIVTLMLELPDGLGVACDSSADALAVARANACKHDVEGRIQFVQSEWFAELDGMFDLVVSNPPYIRTGELVDLAPEVADYDPALALDGGADGLSAYAELVPQAFERLAPGGWLLVEIGADQGKDVSKLFERCGFVEGKGVPRLSRDLAGRDRVVAGIKPG